MSPCFPNHYKIITERRTLGMTDISLFDLVTPDQEQDAFVNTVDMMLKISYQIEDIVIDNALPVDFYAGFQRFSVFRHQNARYKRLADVARRVFVFGEPDIEPPNIPGVQFVPLLPGAALAREWFLVINTPTFFTALLTQEIPGADPIRGDRRFQGIWTYEEGVVNNAHLLITQHLRQPYRPPATRDYRAQNRYLVRMSSKMVQYSEAINLSRAQGANNLSVLAQVAQEISSGSGDYSLAATVQAVRQTLNAATVRLYLNDGNGALQLQAAAARTAGPMPADPLALGQGAPGAAWQTGRTVLVTDTRENGESDPLDPSVRSLAAVPLRSGQGTLGVLVIGRDLVNAFDETALLLLSALAAQMGLALERDHLSQAQDATQRILDSVMGSAADGILTTDGQGRILKINPAAAVALNVAADTLTGRPLTALHNPALDDLCQELLLRGGDAYREMTLADGRPALAGASLVRDAQHAPNGWVIVLRPLDAAGVGRITGPLPITPELDGRQEQGSLGSTTSFPIDQDLDNRLRTISGLTALLPSRVPLDDDQHRYVHQIIKLTRETARMVNNLVYLNQLETRPGFDTVPIPLNTLVGEIVEKFQAAAIRKGTALTVEATADVQAAVHVSALQRALHNLVENANKYTPAGGSIVVRLMGAPDEAQITVTDTGIGLWPRDVALVFNRFYRVVNGTNSDTPSAGLGLAVVKAVAEGHGGRAWATSTLGAGSVFGLAVPVRMGSV